MEAKKKDKENNTHHGHGVKYARSSQGIKQEALAVDMGISQSLVSFYEQKKEIDDEMIERFAKALNVSPEYIKEFEEAPLTVIVEYNTFENNKDSAIATGYIAGDNVVNNNPVEKIVELCEKLLQAEQEKIALLEKLLKEKK